MAISTAQNNVSRTTKQIADLNKSDAALAKKEADLFAKINRASDSAARTRSASTAIEQAREGAPGTAIMRLSELADHVRSSETK